MSARSGRAHAKLNLALGVVHLRPDGFHELRSIFMRLAMHDELGVALLPDGTSEDTLVIDGPIAVPAEDNLVSRAVAAGRAAVGSALPPLALRLHKRIPVEAGLGGGSSDAATALDLAAATWDVEIPDVLDVAARLGADVPFFARGLGAALVSGAGETLSSLPVPDPPAGVLLVTPHDGLSTAAVFGEYDQGGPPPGQGQGARSTETLADLIRDGGDAAAIAAFLDGAGEHNDLWPASARLAPDLRTLREQLESAVGRRVHLTGSGSTLFVLWPSAAEAGRAAARLSEAIPELDERATVAVTTTWTPDRPADGGRS